MNNLFFLSNLLLFLIFSVFPFPLFSSFIPLIGIFIYIVISTNGIISLVSYHKWFIIVIFFFLLSSIWAIRARLSVWAVLMQVRCLVLGMGIIQYCNSYSKFINICKMIVFIGLCLVTYCLLSFDLDTLGKERMANMSEGFNGIGIANTLVLGIYSLLFLIINKSNPHKSNLYYYLLISLFIVFIFLTGSRGALILLVMPICFYYFFNCKSKLKAILIMALLGCLFLVLVMKIPIFYNVLGSRFEEMFNVLKGDYKPNTLDDSRLDFFLLGIEWFKESPLLGYGINCYRELSNTVVGYIGKRLYAHSNVIELLVDVGIVGFIIYYSYFVLFLKEVKKTLKENIRTVRIILSVMLSFLLHDIYGMAYYEWEAQFVIAFSFAIVYYMQNNIFELKQYEAN